MLHIVNPAQLLRKLGYADISLAEENSGVITLTRRGQEVSVPKMTLPKLIFGPERFGETFSGLFPVKLYQWILDVV